MTNLLKDTTMKRITTPIAALLFWGVASILFAAEPLRLDFQFSGVSDDQSAIVERIVRQRVAERSTAGELNVSYAIDSGLEPEEFALETNGTNASIRAGSFPGLIFASGKLLRAIEYSADSFTVPQLALREKPNASFRCCYFARHFHNWYHMATREELERYVEDLALWGFNAIASISVPIINLDLEPDAEEWRQAVDGVKTIRAASKRLGLSFVTMGCPNQAARDMPEELKATPNVDPKRGNNGVNVCPSTPAGLEYMDRVIRTVYGSFIGAQSDFTCWWPFDEGGCECDKCGPWATNGFLRYAARYSKMVNEEFAPNQRFILSTWTYHEDEFEAAWNWVKDHPEVPYVLADAHADFPKYPLEHALPEGHKLITFPEISMQGRSPWGGYGATPQPRRFTELWGQVRGHVDGCMLYSEGLFEDVNKIMEAGFYFRDENAEDSLREYARYELPGCDPEDFVALCRDLETILVLKKKNPEYAAAALDAMKLAVKIDSAILPSLRESWRWRQFYCRCLLEYERDVRGNENTRTYVDAILELQRLYHADLFPKDCVDPFHAWVTPRLPQGEIGDFKRPEEEIQER